MSCTHVWEYDGTAGPAHTRWVCVKCKVTKIQ